MQPIDAQSMALAILIALGGFWLTNVVRRLPHFEMATMAGVRPWACNACMSFWSTVPLSGAHFWISGRAQPLAYIAAAGLSLLLLEFLNPRPPTIPEPLSPPPSAPLDPPSA